MELKTAFGATLKQVRLARHLVQEDFTLVSSRTNISLLERAKTIPTLEKMEELCALMKLHPVTLLTACYMKKEGTSDVSQFLQGIKKELENLKLESDEKPAVKR